MPAISIADDEIYTGTECDLVSAIGQESPSNASDQCPDKVVEISVATQKSGLQIESGLRSADKQVSSVRQSPICPPEENSPLEDHERPTSQQLPASAALRPTEAAPSHIWTGIAFATLRSMDPLRRAAATPAGMAKGMREWSTHHKLLAWAPSFSDLERRPPPQLVVQSAPNRVSTAAAAAAAAEAARIFEDGLICRPRVPRGLLLQQVDIDAIPARSAKRGRLTLRRAAAGRNNFFSRSAGFECGCGSGCGCGCCRRIGPARAAGGAVCGADIGPP